MLLANMLSDFLKLSNINNGINLITPVLDRLWENYNIHNSASSNRASSPNYAFLFYKNPYTMLLII